MTIRITKDRLMEEISAIRDAFILEAEYSEEELKRLNVPTGSSSAAVKTAVKEETEPRELLMEQPGHEAEAKPEAAAKHKTATIVSISLGVVLAAAAIVLFMLFWNPKHSQVASTTEAEMDATQEASEAATQEPIVAVSEVKIDEEHFPDERFRFSVKKAFDADKNDILDEKELAEAKELKVEHMMQTIDIPIYGEHGEVAGSALSSAKIPCYSLEGIEYLTNLERLNCEQHYLKELDLSQNHALTYLDCSGNVLKKLDLSQNSALTEVHCDGNELEKLNVSGLAKLRTLSFEANRLTGLDVSGCPELRELYCLYNDLGELDVSQNTRLEELHLSGSGLTALDLSNNPELKKLCCSGAGALTVLDLGNNTKLERLILVDVGVEALDLSRHTKLTGVHLECANLAKVDFSSAPMLHMNLSCPKLQKLDLSGFPKLETITIAKSALTELNVSRNTKLTFLVCNSGQLTALDVSHNPELETLLCASNRLTELNIANNPKLQALDCSHNKLTALDVSHNPALISLLCMGNDLPELNIEACPEVNSLIVNLDTTIRGAGDNAEVVRYGGEVSLEKTDSDFVRMVDGTYLYEDRFTEKRMTLPWGINSTGVQFDEGIDIDFLSDAIGANSRLTLYRDELTIEGPFYVGFEKGNEPIRGCFRDRTMMQMSSSVVFKVNEQKVSRVNFNEKVDEAVYFVLVIEGGYVTEIDCRFPEHEPEPEQNDLPWAYYDPEDVNR